MSITDGQNDHSAGRVPVRALLSDTSRAVKNGIAPGSSQVGGKAGPVSILSFNSMELT